MWSLVAMIPLRMSVVSSPINTIDRAHPSDAARDEFV